MNYCGIWQPFINSAKPKGQSAKDYIVSEWIKITVAKKITENP